MGEAGLAGGEAGEGSCSCIACRDSWREVKMCHGPCKRDEAGKCSGGCDELTSKGGSGTRASLLRKVRLTHA